jgi:alanine-glyoxylate transaminase/serine-glyoxylate transaminase/serine-pyruvate transaminase
MRAAWEALGLRQVPRDGQAGNTLSVLYFPEGVDGGLIPRVAARGVLVAGGLHAAIRTTSFRVGHMGYAVSQPDMLRRTVQALAEALRESGAPAAPEAALDAFDRHL